MGSSKKTTVSYWYHPFFQLVLHEAPYDKLLEIRGGDVWVWQGELTASGSIEIAAGNAWGGEEKEGGIEGTVDISFGEMDAQPNEFFQTEMGHDPSGHNGYALLQFNSGRYGAGNPYPKPISVLTERIYEGWLDGVCWYPEKAAVTHVGTSKVPAAVLVTGAAKETGGPVWAAANAVATPEFSAIPLSVGANLASAVPAFAGGQWMVVSRFGARTTPATFDSWTAGSLSATSGIRRLVGGAAGWVACHAADSSDAQRVLTSLPAVPESFAYRTLVGTHSTGANASSTLAQANAAFKIGDLYFLTKDRDLYYAESPTGPYEAAWDVGKIVAAGQSPNGACIIEWFDVALFEGEWYAAIQFHFDAGFRRLQLVKSVKGLLDWSDLDVLVDVSRDDVDQAVVCLRVEGASLVGLTADGCAWTSANDWSSRVSTGLAQVRAGPSITSANDLFYAIGFGSGADKVAVGTNGGLNWSLFTLPVGSTSGIAVSPDIYVHGDVVGINPAHVLYDTLSYLQDEPVGSIDEVSFRKAADILYDEGFGICTRYNHAKETVEQFRQRILDLIGGECSRYNGKWYLDLIRELSPEAVATLPVLTDDDILEWQEDPTNRDDAVNQVAVKWFDPVNKQSRLTAQVHSLAAINALGTVNPEVRDYPEVPSELLANRLCLRDLRNKSIPTRRFPLTTNRKPYNWRKARAFRLQSPRRGIADMVCRVGEVDRGTLQSGAIRLVAVQDVFSMPSTAYVVGQPPEPPPSQVPEPIAHQLLLEAPYVELAGVLSAADLAALHEDAGYILAAGVRPGNGQGYALLTRPAGGEFDRIGVFDWCPSAVVVEAAGYTDTEFTLASASLLARVELGTAALWGSEIVRVDALDRVTGAVTFGRGCADTVAVKHPAGERIYFFDTWSASDRVEYVAAETVEAKLLPRTGTQEREQGDVPTLDVTLDQRAARPYPPAKMRVNGEPDPRVIVGAVNVTWAHRDRLVQADQLVDAEVDSVGPEDSTTYTLRAYLNGVLDDEQTAIDGTTASWTPSGAGQARIELFAVRDGLESWQVQVREFAVGAPLLAEDGSPITAEDGSPIIME